MTKDDEWVTCRKSDILSKESKASDQPTDIGEKCVKHDKDTGERNGTHEDKWLIKDLILKREKTKQKGK